MSFRYSLDKFLNNIDVVTRINSSKIEGEAKRAFLTLVFSLNPRAQYF